MNTRNSAPDQGFSYADDPGPGGAAAGQRAGTRPDRCQPLFRQIPPAEPFPIDALGALRAPADAIAAMTQAPPAMCAQSVLAAATLAAQPHFDVVLPTGERRPTSGLFVTVAESGERKTSVDGYATRAVAEAERRLAEQDESVREAFRLDRAAWKEATEAAKAAAKKLGRDAIREALAAIGPEPKEPPLPMLLVADPSPEALAMHLADGRPHAGLFTDEAAILLGGAAFNDETAMRTGGLLNVLWDGRPVRRLRVLTGHRFAPGRRLTCHLMMQGVVADRLFGDPTLRGIGLLARTLLVAPQSTAGTRFWNDPAPAVQATLSAYDGTLRRLLDRAPRVLDGGALDPSPLAFTADGRDILIALYNAVERSIADGGALSGLRAFAGKAMEHAARVAAVMCTYADPDAVEIGAHETANACALVEYYAGEMLRLGETARIDPDLLLADRLLSWWRARPDPRCYAVAIYQTGPNPLRDAATARRIIGVLEGHGWVKRLPIGTEIDGAPRREAWCLVPHEAGAAP